MTERVAEVERRTKETAISVSINLDGTGKTDITTGIGFFDHMLDAFARHGLMDLTLRCEGDLFVDGHHSVEDTGIVLGQAVALALGDKAGITRFASATIPMDEALVMVALDISGRGQYFGDLDLPFGMVGDFDCALAREFFIAFAANAGITLHVNQWAGINAHHIIEAAFKAFGRSLRFACEEDPRLHGALPSTKGAL